MKPRAQITRAQNLRVEPGSRTRANKCERARVMARARKDFDRAAAPASEITDGLNYTSPGVRRVLN